MIKFKELVNDFYSLVQQSKFIEALDKFYDDDVISTDNTDEPIRGIEIHRKVASKFLSNAKIDKIELVSSIVDEDLSIAVWHYIFTHNNYGHVDFKQVSVNVGEMVKSFRKIIYITLQFESRIVERKTLM